jgi:hypothetical protein
MVFMPTRNDAELVGKKACPPYKNAMMWLWIGGQKILPTLLVIW